VAVSQGLRQDTRTSRGGHRDSLSIALRGDASKDAARSKAGVFAPSTCPTVTWRRSKLSDQAEHGEESSRCTTLRDPVHRQAHESERRYGLFFESALEGFAYCRMLYDAEGRPDDFVHLGG